jgi:hypothetical protein
MLQKIETGINDASAQSVSRIIGECFVTPSLRRAGQRVARDFSDSVVSSSVESAVKTELTLGLGQKVQTDSAAYPMGTAGSSPTVKRPGKREKFTFTLMRKIHIMQLHLILRFGNTEMYSGDTR